VHVVVHSGGRHDPGNLGRFPRAAVDFALEHPYSGPTPRGRRDNS
jgi:UTP--glucose-1-phosphate uridylyltransferase